MQTAAVAESLPAVDVISGAEQAAEWQRYVDAHPLGTVYHSLAWRRIFSATFGYRSWYLVARDGGAITGCLPLFLVRAPFSRRLVSVPFRDRGGVLWSAGAAFHALVGAARKIAERENAAYLELKTVQPYPEFLVRQNALVERKYWIRSAIDLRALDRQRFWSGIGPKTRNMVRHAEAAGLSFNEETASPDRGAMWYRLFLQTQKRHGLPPFSPRFFRLIFDELLHHVRLFVVRKGTEPLAATILLGQHNTAIYAYAASTDAARLHGAGDFLMFRTILRLLENGYEEFDLGSDAPSQENLLFFKRKWLASQSAIPTYTIGHYRSADGDSSDARYETARRVVRHLPLPVLRLLGAGVSRFFG